MITNRKHLENWIHYLREQNYQLRRYRDFPLDKLSMNHKEELTKHAEAWQKDPNHFTFHHLRNLFDDLSRNPIRYPMVGTVQHNEINIDPGGSRLMVSKYLGLKNTVLDLIVHEHHDRLMDFELIDTADKFCEIYKTSKSDFHVQFDRNDINNQTYEKWYQINWQDMMHFNTVDIKGFNNKFHEQNKHKDEVLELYFL